MERTIRILKIALPIIFVGFILIIALSWTQKRGRDRTETAPVVPTRPNEKAIIESREFEDTQTIGGRVVSRIRARRVVSHTSDWTTLEDVQITIYRPNNLTYELVCPKAEFNSITKEADAKGGVKVNSSDGVEIQTAQINFDGNRLTNDINVQFKVDRWNGNAGGLDLDVQAETLKLFKKVAATATPTATEPPMTLASEETLFRRRENDVTFTQNVVVTRAADQLMSDRVIGRFTQDRKTLVGLEGN
ncbi:MAG TPA: LPS export ABC transporter periplasmic protein LptC, partial [Thermoanaerobaculia bacterium]|nr:LPS export ABC transporter periplasmic protein LptC [Thermoanaerobaculia bacterium]